MDYSKIVEVPEHETSHDHESLEQIKTELFKRVMKADWESIREIYKTEKSSAHYLKITRSGDTALHIAVSDGQEDTVRDLITAMGNDRAKVAVNIKNGLENTPLHTAAAMGNRPMCKLIAEVDPLLVGKRNSDGETPFFLAALNGKKEAFLYLHKIFAKSADDHPSSEHTGYNISQREDGDTILHCAINGEYFGERILINNCLFVVIYFLLK